MKTDYDVAVIGAGAAGVAAASAAADAGARVLLVESSDRLGGTVSAAMHRCLCGLYSHAPQSPLDTLNGQTQQDVVAKMAHIDPASVKTRQMGRAWVLEFSTSAWETALAEICCRQNIDRRMNSRVVAVHRDGNRIAAVEIDGPALVDSTTASRRPLTCGALIDCTGAGIVLQMIGGDIALPPDADRMLGGFSVRLAGLNGDLELLRLQTPYALTQAASGGALPREARLTMFHPGPGPGEGICKLAVNADHFSADEARRFATGVVDYLRREVSGYSTARVVEMSPRPLARDGRRLRGEIVVTEQNVLEARRHGPDAVHAWWPVERWDVNAGPTYDYPPVGAHYDIPDAALRSAVAPNLFAAGACLSATAGAAASLRASGICLATGHAAGRLAGLIVRRVSIA
ncbi:MAG TPA: FAD-dependent oxidoreductase [Tepidisphaeraceae bacterium]|jgi:hypothetical protein|nr:FAD-dependent oxidoreductase [Tepidisphaeraceae bacterium]